MVDSEVGKSYGEDDYYKDDEEDENVRWDEDKVAIEMREGMTDEMTDVAQVDIRATLNANPFKKLSSQTDYYFRANNTKKPQTRKRKRGEIDDHCDATKTNDKEEIEPFCTEENENVGLNENNNNENSQEHVGKSIPFTFEEARNEFEAWLARLEQYPYCLDMKNWKTTRKCSCVYDAIKQHNSLLVTILAKESMKKKKDRNSYFVKIIHEANIQRKNKKRKRQENSSKRYYVISLVENQEEEPQKCNAHDNYEGGTSNEIEYFLEKITRNIDNSNSQQWKEASFDRMGSPHSESHVRLCMNWFRNLFMLREQAWRTLTKFVKNEGDECIQKEMIHKNQGNRNRTRSSKKFEARPSVISYLQDLGEAYGSVKFLRKPINKNYDIEDQRHDKVAAIELPSSMVKRSIYVNFCWHQGWIVPDGGSKANYGSIQDYNPRIDDEWTELEKERGTICSYSCFMDLWEAHLPSIRVRSDEKE